jgi:hypothetical protein
MHAGGMMTTKQQQASISSAVSKYFLQVTLQINLCNKNYQQILKADEEALSLSLSLSLLFCLQAILKMKEMSESSWVVLGFVARKDRKTDKIICGRNAMESKGIPPSPTTRISEYTSLMDFGP